MTDVWYERKTKQLLLQCSSVYSITDQKNSQTVYRDQRSNPYTKAVQVVRFDILLHVR